MNLIEKLAKDLKLGNSYIESIVNRADYYYRDYTIPKKNGGQRNIAQPSPELKTLQYWVLKNILLRLPVSKYAVAYKKGDSVKNNALLHTKSSYFLHIDIKDFFNSIRFFHLEGILRENRNVFDDLHIDINDALNEIAKICFRRNRLSIGAVSSPAISNIIMFSFDVDISVYCRQHGFTYTRYADDIYISSEKYINNEVLVFVEQKLLGKQLFLNRKKTRFCSKKYKIKITGLIIGTDQNIYWGTERKKQLKKMLYDKLVHGRGDSNRLLGWLAFLRNVEPIFYSKLLIKYSKYCKDDIIDFLKNNSIIKQ